MLRYYVRTTEALKRLRTDKDGVVSLEYVIVGAGVCAVVLALVQGTGTNTLSGALTTGFTATVNAELRVAAVQETITVSGASPVVDTQNVRTQNVLSREVLDTIPTGKTIQGYAALTVGATAVGFGPEQDVGGNKGESPGSIRIHGNREFDLKLLWDGMRFNGAYGAGGGGVRAALEHLLGVHVRAVRGVHTTRQTHPLTTCSPGERTEQ